MSSQTADALVTKVKRMIEANELDRAERICLGGVSWFPTDARFLRLLGMVHGYCERHVAAQRVWTEAYEMEGSDIDLANAVVSYYAIGDFQTALDLLKNDFEVFSDEAKRIIALNTEEAVRVGGLSYHELPFELVLYMKELMAGYR